MGKCYCGTFKEAHKTGWFIGPRYERLVWSPCFGLLALI
jgi:hypothetical protein